jgi:valyl-tRNA synthetase
VRRSRRRFWKSEADTDKQAAYATLYEVLVTLTKLLAPFVPFVTEHMYQNLVRSVETQAPLSVHHCDWPQADEAKAEPALLADMAAARAVVALGHAVRAGGNLKVRQPLGRVVVVAPPDQRERLQRHAALITDELLPENRTLGPKFGQLFPAVRKALAASDPPAAVLTLRAGQNLPLNLEGQMVELTPADVIITPQPKPGFAVRAEGEYVVALDTALTPELRAEGWAREIVRRVQDLRKTAGFEISDRIATYYMAAPELAGAMVTHADYIKNETLTVTLAEAAITKQAEASVLVAVRQPGGALIRQLSNATVMEDKVDGEAVTLALEKMAPEPKPKAKAASRKATAKKTPARKVPAKKPGAKKAAAKKPASAQPKAKAGVKKAAAKKRAALKARVKKPAK